MLILFVQYFCSSNPFLSFDTALIFRFKFDLRRRRGTEGFGRRTHGLFRPLPFVHRVALTLPTNKTACVLPFGHECRHNPWPARDFGRREFFRIRPRPISTFWFWRRLVVIKRRSGRGVQVQTKSWSEIGPWCDVRQRSAGDRMSIRRRRRNS